jgi:hypothetical protein
MDEISDRLPSRQSIDVSRLFDHSPNTITVVPRYREGRMTRGTGSTTRPAARADLRPDSPFGTGPFHAALREAIRERGLTLDRLRSHLARRGVSVALSTLSSWQHGNARPGVSSLRAVRALEEILRLPSGSLIHLLVMPGGEPAREAGNGRRAPLRPVRGLDEHHGALAQLLDRLPGSRDRGIDVLSHQDKVLVDAQGRAWVIWSRTAVRARRDGVDRYVVRYFGDEGCRADQVRVVTRENCRLGRIVCHDEVPVLAAELLFGQAMRAGDTWVFEYEVVDKTGQRCFEHGHGFVEPQDMYLLEVRFDPRALPVDCHAYAQPGLYDERRRTADLTLNNHHAVHLVVSGVTAGVIGIGWTWLG